MGRVLLILCLSLIATPQVERDLNPADNVAVTSLLQGVESQSLIIITPQKQYTWFCGKKFEIANDLYIDENGELWQPLQVITTAYTYRDGIENPTTATLSDAITSYGIAASADILPYDTTIMVPGYGTYQVDDTGKIPMQNARQGIIQLDLRIPHKRYDGVWRSEAECVEMCMKHGIRNVMVLVKLN